LLLKERSVKEYQKAALSVIEDIRNLTDLSNSLLLLARTRSEITDRSTTLVRLDELLWQTADEIKKVHADFNINISIDFNYSSGDAEEMTVTGNEYLLRVALSNLIENGCKFSDNNTTEVRMSCREGIITITFTDKGIGIPPEDLEKIFEPFHRGSNVKSVYGHGIGLSLVKGIIKNHNGTIQLESVLGEGTEVVIRVPLA
jgi:signal transduction histidine kinase